MMKKLTAVLLALCLCLCLLPAACAEQSGVTMEALAAANTREALLANHESAYLLWIDPENGEASGMLYATAGYTFDEQYWILYTPEANWWIDQDEDGKYSLSLMWYVMTVDEQAECMIDYRNCEFFNPDALELMEIAEIEENGDGTLSVTCVVSGEEFKELQERYGYEIPAEFEGISGKTVWTVDAETLEIQSYEEYTVLNGESELLSSMIMEYDVPEPELLEWVLEEAEANRASELEAPRTVTIIYDAGTEAEETYSFTAGAYRLIPQLREGYILYSDAEGTEAFPGSDELGDLTVYAFHAE